MKPLGNRLVIRRIQLDEHGEEKGIFIPTAISTRQMREEPAFFCEVVTCGTGRKLAEKQPEIQPGVRLIFRNDTGTQVLSDGTEIVSAIDALAVLTHEPV